MSLPATVPLFGIGTTEAIIIGLAILVLFGATRLPKLGKGIGEGIRNFKLSIKGDEETSSKQIADADAVSKNH